MLQATSEVVDLASQTLRELHATLHALPPETNRTAWEVINWLPNLAASASSVPASAFGSGRFKLLVMVVPKRYPPDAGGPLQRIYWGSRE